MQQPANQNVYLKTPVTGPKSAALRERVALRTWRDVLVHALAAGIVVDSASGTAVTDVDGNTFLDFIGGFAVGALGHSHPTWVDAIQKQAAKAAVGSLTSTARVELFERFAKHAPANGVHRLQMYSGGAEAVESALRLAKSYTGKYEFVSCWGGFRGKTMGALTLMGSTFKDKLGPMAPGSHQVPYADCYRCPLKLEYGKCGMACLEIARNYVKVATAGEVADVIVAPLQGTAGNNLPPKEFLPGMASIAKEVGALFIADEMITGLGRTGAWWGVRRTGVVPDIVTLGTAVGG